MFVAFGPDQFIIELKLRHDRHTEEEGLKQILRYMDRMNMNCGCLILFEINPKDSREKRIYRKEIEKEGKRISLLCM